MTHNTFTPIGNGAMSPPNALRQAVPPRTAGQAGEGVALAASPDVLERMQDPAVSLVQWRRRPPPLLAAWLDRLPSNALPSIRLRVEPAHPHAILTALADTDLPACGERELLAEDIADLVRRFATLIGTPALDLRLEAQGTNGGAGDHEACPLFHADHVTIRLLTTYRGPGTEWLRPDSPDTVNPSHAWGAAGSPEIHRVARYDVAVFRGTRGPGRPLIHRTPALDRKTGPRLVLNLTPPQALSRP